LATFPQGDIGHGRNVAATKGMAMSNKPVKAPGRGLRVADKALVVVVGVVGVVIAFAALHFVVGLIWEVVKIAVIVAVVGAVLWLVGRRRR
jgi:Flp pilus assembly protein TadB